MPAADSTVTTDPTLVSLGKFGEPEHWANIAYGVPIFTPHQRWRHFDDEGNKLPEPEFLYEIGEEDLREIAENCARREQERNVAGLMTLGHRRQGADAKNQQMQPPTAGFERNHRFGFFTNSKGERIPAVLADLYYGKRRWDEAQEYPFRSAEYYHQSKLITGVALLKSDPALDMGMTVYHQSGAAEPCYLYCAVQPGEVYQGATMPEVDRQTVPPGGSIQTGNKNVDSGPQKIGLETGRASDPEPMRDYPNPGRGGNNREAIAYQKGQIDKFVKKTNKRFKKGMRKATAKLYAKLGITDDYQAGPGMPGPSNVAIPNVVKIKGGKKKDRVPVVTDDDDGGGAVDHQYQRAIARERTLATELESMQQQISQIQREKLVAQCYQGIMELANEGVIFHDPPGTKPEQAGVGMRMEAERLAKIEDPKDRNAEFERIANQYQRARGSNNMRFYGATPGVSQIQPSLPKRPENKAEMYEAIRRATAHNTDPANKNSPMSYRQAIQAVRAQEN